MSRRAPAVGRRGDRTPGSADVRERDVAAGDDRVGRLREALATIAGRACEWWRCGLDHRPCSPCVAREALGPTGR